MAVATKHVISQRRVIGALARAVEELTAARGDGDQAIVAAQLRQFLADLR